MSDDQGVYFSLEDYAGFWHRLGAWIIDSIVIVIFVSISWYASYYTINDPLTMLRIIFLLSVLFAYIYLAIIKASKIKTIGYRIFNIRIIDLFGNTPNWHTMILRFFLLFFGPFTFIIDILWLTGEQTKQTLRDKLSGTYVIKEGCSPQGHAPLRHVRLHFMGWNLSFTELDR